MYGVSQLTLPARLVHAMIMAHMTDEMVVQKEVVIHGALIRDIGAGPDIMILFVDKGVATIANSFEQKIRLDIFPIWPCQQI